MAQSYLQIQRQIETLQRQAEKLKSQEVAGVVERIKVAIAHYGLTAEQLGFGAEKPASRKAVKSRGNASPTASKTAKYTDGQGNVWSGRGPRPHWLRDALATGKSLESFASGDGSATSANSRPKTAKEKTVKEKSPRPKAASKRTAQHYRDQNGNAWSGFGPKPRWLKDALAAGATLAQFAVAPSA